MTAGGLGGKRVLVAEDEPLIAMLFETVLAGAGAEVIGAATSVAEALALIDQRGNTIDVALLDGNLGGDPVFPVAESLAVLGVPFVFLTGYDANGFSQHYPAAPVLRKPVGAPVLLETLRTCLKDNALDR